MTPATKDKRRGGQGDRGAALVLVLWGVAVMSIIAIAVARESSQSALSANAGVELTDARALADAGVRVGWSAWSSGVVPASGEWGCRTGQGAIFAVIRSEDGKVDLNASPESVLAALFRVAGADDDRAGSIAASILDYSDADEAQLTNGAEAATYERLGVPWRPRDFDFETIEELAYVPGVDAALYERVLPYITVNSGAGEVLDRSQASPFVLAVLEDHAARAAGAAGLDASGSEGVAESVEAGVAGTSVPATAPNAPAEQTVSVRVIATTATGAVFVREAIVAPPSTADDAPRFLRYAAGRLGETEKLPDATGLTACF